MDKYEYKIKIDQMKTLMGEKDYATAAEIADTINWRKVKNVNLLVKAGDAYFKTKRYEEARDILLMAYDRSPIGRMIIYRLAEISIKMKNFEEAEEYYDEFVEIAPHDNLKYVLRYKINKAKGSDYQTLIAILEELKEVEYTEEWTYELAFLYHKTGESEKCVEACDELILWFGEGIYVERALELKMLYQPLTKAQEDKYRLLKQGKVKQKEVNPQEEEIKIPTVAESTDKFDTMNLQKELAKSMQQIMEATEQETVTDTMDNIKKMVEEIPYLQKPKEESPADSESYGYMNTSEEIDGSLRSNFKEILEEDEAGETGMASAGLQPQMTDAQMSIESILSEWEKTKRAAEAALQMAEQQKLESAKAQALQEAGDIMDRLSDVIPKLDSGIAPSQILKEEYLSEPNITEEERAGRIVAGMNDILQQQIDRLKEEEEITKKAEHELLRKIKQAKPNFDEQIGLRPYIPNQFDTAEEAAETPEEELSEEAENPQKLEEPVETGDSDEFEEREEEEISESLEEFEEGEDAESLEEIRGTEETVMPDQSEQEATSDNPAADVSKDVFSLPEIAVPEDIEADLPKQDTREIKTEEITKAIDAQVQKIESEEEEPVAGERRAITKLSEEQKKIFSYFVPVDGMESQICQALTGASARLAGSRNSAAGNILIQGGRGCGKTVLATGLIKSLQKEVRRPNGKIGKIDAGTLNKKDIAQILKKVSGGCLIIERAGEINRETAVKLSLLLESDTSGLLVIMEDTRVGINQALGRDEGLAKKFTEKITIPVFTSDELVAFGKAYANDLNYEIDDMGVLALYNRISNIQKIDRATTLTEVKEIVDGAIENAERKTFKRAFSIITSRRYTEDDYIILREKDFEE